MRAIYEKVATYLDVDADALESFGNEDKIGGVHTGWPVGSIFNTEGQLLYAVTRMLQPEHIFEIGVYHGCSTSHLLTALDENENGTLHSIDIVETAGDMIQEMLKARWKFYAMDAVDFLKSRAKTMKKRPLVVFEDGPHDYLFTRNALQAAKDLSPDLIISHDILHFVVGSDMRRAWDEVFGAGNYIAVMPDGSDCGLGFWRPS